MGVMAEIGQMRLKNHYKFPLVGIAPEELVTWPDGPQGTKFLWMGKKRWQLEPQWRPGATKLKVDGSCPLV